MVPPASFPAPEEGEPLTRGYDVGLVKDAAAEAGIGPKYVERALAEREAAVLPAVAMRVEEGPQLQKSPNMFLGAHTKLVYEAVVEGELTMDAFEDLADIARRSLGDILNVSAVGRTLTMNTNVMRNGQGGVGRILQITVVVRNGRTTVRIFEDLTGAAGGMFGGLVGGVGVALGAIAMGLITKSGSPELGMVVWAATAASVFGLVRWGFVRHVGTKRREMRELVEEIGRFIQTNIAQNTRAQGALPAGPTGRSPSADR